MPRRIGPATELQGRPGRCQSYNERVFIMLDITDAMSAAERLLNETPAQGRDRLARARDALLRDARNPNVRGDQRGRASALASRLEAAARAVDA